MSTIDRPNLRWKQHMYVCVCLCV